ncbi:MAG TPA: TIGR01841 family phasin [Caulobacteraceae bacterium]|nr:TIGR01841 family phasin [Caulobacteraceae bacterium]
MTEGVETMKATVDQFTAAGNQAFKDNVEKSLTALNEINTQAKQNLEALVASATAATKGAEAVSAQTIAFSKQAFEEQVAAAKQLAGAKSVQEAFELQTAWAKSAFESYIANFGKLTETVTESVKETVKPLNERVAAVAERAQAAA